MLLLDVAGAYDMVSHERLLFNMRQMRLGASSQDDIWEVPDDPASHDGMPVIIPGDPTPTILAPTGTAKYLGIWLDKHLNFTTHRKKMLAKGASSLEALRAISGST
ncbi:hypothetical protein PENFLA_c078G02808 [Penicillium flavigenum]|uniref:Reverse transcriptase domain-containing protein n=1 Tax=Penicillium flavigenum TaxID=254877 RepID=A0A1V6SC62_9EURO|nr:hypothetical protein PENFLA_c078G02808 [Penicillium flavigenum]